MALPRGFDDITVLMEVGLDTWQEVLETAGESSRFGNHELTYDVLCNSLTETSPGKPLSDALLHMHDLGTELGRSCVINIAEEQAYSLDELDGLANREFVAQMWLRATRGDADATSVLAFAQSTIDATATRRAKEYASVENPKRGISKEQIENRLRELLPQLRGDDASIKSHEADGEWRFTVLHGERLKQVTQMKNGKPAPLRYFPAASDIIAYNRQFNRITIITRSPQAGRAYKEALGNIIGGRSDFFSSEEVCSLEPLRKKGSELLSSGLNPQVLSVFVTELGWRRNDRDTVLVRGRDCYRILGELGARFDEGMFFEAKLSLTIAASNQKARVFIRVPNAIEINPRTHEGVVENYLERVGIRGPFKGDEIETLWSTYPARRSRRVWERFIQGDMKALVSGGILRPTTLESVEHPALHAALKLGVEQAPDGSIVGISSDPTTPTARNLTPSDYEGYELDEAALARKLAKELKLDSPCQMLDTGLWFLGARKFSNGKAINIFVAFREPSEYSERLIELHRPNEPRVLLIPHGTAANVATKQVECALPSGPWSDVIPTAVRRLSLAQCLPPIEWASESLIISESSGQVWYLRVEITALQPGTHPFKFITRLAETPGILVSTKKLNELLSPHGDPKVAAAAKRKFLAAIKKTFEEDGRALPDELNNMIRSLPHGYRLATSALLLGPTATDDTLPDRTAARAV